MSSLLMSAIKWSGALHFWQTISIPNVRRKSSDQEVYLDVFLGLFCVRGVGSPGEGTTLSDHAFLSSSLTVSLSRILRRSLAIFFAQGLVGDDGYFAIAWGCHEGDDTTSPTARSPLVSIPARRPEGTAGGEIRTILDLRLQQQVEWAVRAHVRDRHQLGLVSAAAAILDALEKVCVNHFLETQ